MKLDFIHSMSYSARHANANRSHQKGIEHVFESRLSGEIHSGRGRHHRIAGAADGRPLRSGEAAGVMPVTLPPNRQSVQRDNESRHLDRLSLLMQKDHEKFQS